MSVYEREREENIKRNEEFLKGIGLNSLKREIVDVDTEKKKTSLPPSRVRKRKISLGNLANESLRRSARLKGVKMVDSSDFKDGPPKPEKEAILRIGTGKVEQGDKSLDMKKKIEPQDLLNFIARSNEKHSDIVDNTGIVLCCDRINSMSQASLSLRLRRIKQTSKMIVFYYGLRLAGLDHLANDAKLTLQESHKVIFS